MNRSFDYIIVGAGLQGGLLGLAINHYQPQASVLLVDDGDQIGGNHTWSFHQGDIPPRAWPWLDQVITSRWSSYEVKFPDFKRQVCIPYASIDSGYFGRTIEQLFRSENADSTTLPIGVSARSAVLPELRGGDAATNLQTATVPISIQQPTSELRLKTAVDHVANDAIYTGDTRIAGKVVVDCRGPERAELHSVGHCGYQKFYGFEIELSEPWPDQNPIVMDSCVSQAEGFRFTYSLPFTRHRVLVEDTQFSTTRELDRDESLQKVSAYVARKVQSDWQLIREESGCLPMPWNGALMPTSDLPLRGGYAGGWFHAATGYSLPLAARWADTVASNPADRVAAAVQTLASEHQAQAKLARFLNRLLFRLVKPDRRYEIFRRFYRVLSEEAIARFYAHQFTTRDLAKILVGRPPSRLTPLLFINSFVRER